MVDRLENDEVNMNTDFQRSGDLWSDGQQSRLIESLLLGLPLPAFYFDTSDNRWGIIDGLQRCCSIYNFCVAKTLKLQDLDYLKGLEKQGFDDLERTLKRSILTRPITVNLLEKGAPRQVRYILFKRLNTGGLELKPQEIRNAIFKVRFHLLLKDWLNLKNLYVLQTHEYQRGECKILILYLVFWHFISLKMKSMNPIWMLSLLKD